MEESEGRICAEYLYAYPPGIPILAPGEYIKKEHLEILKQMETDGNRIHHTVSEEPDRITCLAE
jgi:arginine/lysine/ornithine decarboxylase